MGITVGVVWLVGFVVSGVVGKLMGFCANKVSACGVVMISVIWPVSVVLLAFALPASLIVYLIEKLAEVLVD